MILTQKFYTFALLLVSLLSVLIMVKKTHIPQELSQERAKKRDMELERIESKTRVNEFCEQYALIVDEDGWFPCYNSDGTTMIYLLEGEVWKYGKTCNGQSGRYPSGLPYPNLQYALQFTGSENECLIIEKQKIYGYAILPENLDRAGRTGTKLLIRPPGNKIDR